MICVNKEDAAVVDAGVAWDQRVVVVCPCAVRESVHVCAVSIRNENEKKTYPLRFVPIRHMQRWMAWSIAVVVDVGVGQRVASSVLLLFSHPKSGLLHNQETFSRTQVYANLT